MSHDEDFQTKSETFLAWFKIQPGTQFHPNLKVVDLRQNTAGRGIVATTSIEADADLFTIPRDIVITKENSSLFKRHPTIFDRLSEVEGIDYENFDWLALVLTLMYEYFVDDASPWKPYLDVLPSDFQTLMFWTDDELEELQASAVRQKIGKADADLIFRTKLVPFLHHYQNIFITGTDCKLKDQELIALAHRVGM
jgi:SET domain-containing protein 6